MTSDGHARTTAALLVILSGTRLLRLVDADAADAVEALVRAAAERLAVKLHGDELAINDKRG
jgi:hypothetical protein